MADRFHITSDEFDELCESGFIKGRRNEGDTAVILIDVPDSLELDFDEAVNICMKFSREKQLETKFQYNYDNKIEVLSPICYSLDKQSISGIVHRDLIEYKRVGEIHFHYKKNHGGFTLGDLLYPLNYTRYKIYEIKVGNPMTKLIYTINMKQFKKDEQWINKLYQFKEETDKLFQKNFEEFYWIDRAGYFGHTNKGKKFMTRNSYLFQKLIEPITTIEEWEEN